MTRGQENTVQQGWSPGDLFDNNPTAGSLANFVQAGGPPQSSTSVIYVGTDTSTTVNLINCRTNPVPASLTPGMQFNIKVANTNNGVVTAQLNGLAPIPVTRSDGSAMQGKELTVGQEMIFVYTGTALEAMYPGVTGVVLPPTAPTAPPTPAKPARTIFYLEQNGYDGADGSTNHFPPAIGGGYLSIGAVGPMQTVQGVINKFQDGTYPPVSDVYIFLGTAYGFGNFYGGFSDLSGIVGCWHVIGVPTPAGSTPVDQPVQYQVTIYACGGDVPQYPGGNPVNLPPYPYYQPYVSQSIGCQAGGRAVFDLRNLGFAYRSPTLLGVYPPVTGALVATNGGTIFTTNCAFWDEGAQSWKPNLIIPPGPDQSEHYAITVQSGGQVALFGNISYDTVYSYVGLISASGAQAVVGCNDPWTQGKPFVPAQIQVAHIGTPPSTQSRGQIFNVNKNATVTFNGSVQILGDNDLDDTNVIPYVVTTGAGIVLKGNTIPGGQAPVLVGPGWVTL